MRRERRPWRLWLAGAFFAAGLAYGFWYVFLLADPFHLVVVQRLDPLVVPCWALGWACAAAALWSARPRWWLALPAIGAGLYVAAMSTFPLWLDSPSEQVARWRAPDGRHDVRLVHTWYVIDPVYEVRVREHRGLLSREYVVWAAESESPPAVRFVGPATVEVAGPDGTDVVTF